MPSPADVRRRALLAAAKVTLSLSALACTDTESPSATTALTPGAAGSQSSAGATAHAGQTAAGPGGAAGQVAGASGSSGQAGGAAGHGGSVYALACGLPSDSAPTDETVACCHERLDAVLPVDPANVWDSPAGPAALEAAEQACCEVVVISRDAAPPGDEPFDEVAWKKASRCCPYLDHEDPTFFGPTCTPWGPPMPPAMPGWLADERAAV